MKEEGNSKIATLEGQKATAAAQSKTVLEDRLADLRSEYEGRTKRLQDALNSRKTENATQVA